MREILVLRMQASLLDPLPPPAWPDGLRTTRWLQDGAPAVHALLHQAYSAGGGDIPPYPEWLDAFISDPEFDPALCTLAWAGHDLAGCVLCWSSSFIKDLGVAPAHRRRGLGEALIRATMAIMRSRGARSISLKVDADNPSNAASLYSRCGFRTVEQIRLALP